MKMDNKGSKQAGKDNLLEDHSIASRKKIRDEMQSEVEVFLMRGGHIQQVAPHVMADPPQKPTNNYCSRPI